MILIGIGANLPSEAYGPPRATCGAALDLLEDMDTGLGMGLGMGITIVKRSPWYRSAPVPISDQPWYVNGVIRVETACDPESLMSHLLTVEARLGRQRSVPNAPRTVDLDILAFGERILTAEQNSPNNLLIPHPRMHERAFVIKPLHDIEPDWIHPDTGISVGQYLANLPSGQQTEPMKDADGHHGTEWMAHA